MLVHPAPARASRRLIVLALAALALLPAGPASADEPAGGAAPLTDGLPYFNGRSGGSNGLNAQSFTATRSGFVSRVVLPLASDHGSPLGNHDNGTGSVIVELRPMAEGKPSATVLASTSIRSEELTKSSFSFEEIRFPDPVRVAAGSRYAVVLTARDDGRPYFSYRWASGQRIEPIFYGRWDWDANDELNLRWSASEFSTALELRVDAHAPAISVDRASGTTVARDAREPLAFSCEDETDGPVACDAVAEQGDRRVPLASGDDLPSDALGTWRVVVTAHDRAGNDARQEVLYEVVDVTAPTVTITAPTEGQDVPIGSTLRPVVTCTDEDGGSGLDGGCRVTKDVDTATAGSRTFSVEAVDRAGNVGRASVTYDVVWPWAGFFAPLDGAGTLNLVKAGAAVPVKFSLGGDRGLGILDGAPTSRPISCSPSAAVDAVEEAAVTQSGLSFDAATQRYGLVWKTSRDWAGQCRRLSVKLADGSVHTADFQLK